MSADLLTPLWRAGQAPALSSREWEMLLAQARATRLAARLAHHFQARGWWPAVPDAVKHQLAGAQRFADRLRQEVQWEIDHIVGALRHLPTPIVLLKGAAYVAAGLPPGLGRLFSDVDILVSRDQLPHVELALLAAGWAPERLKPYDDRYYRQWMHELPPLQHVKRQSFLDVHHTITAPTSRFAIDGKRLLQRCVPLADEPRLSVLAPVDMVLHSAVHLLQEGDFSAGLRDLLDINDLLLHFGDQPGFWADLDARASSLGLVRPLRHVMGQLNRLFATPIAPQSTGLRTESAAVRDRLMGRLLAQALRPQHDSCDSGLTRLSRRLLYVRSHWLRMPWYQIAPHLARKSWSRLIDKHEFLRRSNPPF